MVRRQQPGLLPSGPIHSLRSPTCLPDDTCMKTAHWLTLMRECVCRTQNSCQLSVVQKRKLSCKTTNSVRQWLRKQQNRWWHARLATTSIPMKDSDHHHPRMHEGCTGNLGSTSKHLRRLPLMCNVPCGCCLRGRVSHETGRTEQGPSKFSLNENAAAGAATAAAPLVSDSEAAHQQLVPTGLPA